MDIVVRGRQIEVSERFRDHVSQRLERLENHGFILQRVDVEVTKERNPRLADQAIRVELTCQARGEERTPCNRRAPYPSAPNHSRLPSDAPAANHQRPGSPCVAAMPPRSRTVSR